jgi:hypothetical protein
MSVHGKNFFLVKIDFFYFMALNEVSTGKLIAHVGSLT